MSGILSYPNWKGIVSSLVFVLLIRSITGMLALIKNSLWRKETYGKATGYQSLFAIVSYAVLFSIII